jgi:capreomycidine synthase
MRNFPPALLEEWMRLYYFAVDADIGSSGVSDHSLAEVRALVGIGVEEMDAIVFHDSQTLGGDGVRRAVARRWTRGDPDRVMVTHGSTEAIFLAMNALLRPGDEVVVLDPVYPGLGDVVRGLGCRTRHWTLRAEDGWRPDLDALEALVTERTRMVVVNFPHNPTGATLTPAEQDALLAIVERAGTWLLWDGAFADLTYGTAPLPDPVNRYARTVSLGTLSKGYGLPGLRVGWCLADPEVLDRMARVRDYTTLHLSPLVELIAERVLDGAERILGRKRAAAAHNRDLVQQWMDEQDGAISWTAPMGGVCGFPRLHEVPDVEAFCHALALEHRVMLVPGTCFGTPGHARLGFGGHTPVLEEGLGRLAEALRTAGVPALV